MILNLSQKADLIKKIDNLPQTLKNHLDSYYSHLIPGIMKFILWFNAIKSTGWLASALHTIGIQI